MKIPKNLEADRLNIQPISLKYAKDIFNEFTAEITTFMFPKAPEEINETYAFIESAKKKLQKGTDFIVVILDKKSGEFLGCGGLHNINTKTLEAGIWIKKSAHGKKYGREAIETLINWAKDNLDYKYIKYPVDERNTASRKIPESLGGIIEGEYNATSLSGKKLHGLEYRIYKK